MKSLSRHCTSQGNIQNDGDDGEEEVLREEVVDILERHQLIEQITKGFPRGHPMVRTFQEVERDADRIAN